MANGPFYSVGLHVGEITKQGLSKTSTGKPQFVLGVKILGQPSADGVVPWQQQYERTVYMVLTDKTIDFATENLKRLGFTGTSLSQLDPSNATFQSFKGNQVELWCKHEPDQQGQMRERWQVSNGGINAISGDPLDQREMRQLDTLFGRALRTGTPPSPSAYTNTEITDDDVPF